MAELAKDVYLGRLDRKEFPDGERYLRIDEDVDGKHVVILGGTISDSDTLEIFDLACAAVKYGAKELTLAIPYFGYSTMERAVKPGEVVPAKTRARLLSCIPKAHKGNNVILLDLHSLGIPHYFEGDIRTKHVYAKQAVISLILSAARPHEPPLIRGTSSRNQFVLGSTDAGRAKWVESLAQELKVDAAFCYKRRTSGSDTEIVGVNAEVKGKYVVVYDDMIRTGGSIANAATAYMNAGAKGIGIVTTHGLFVGDCLQRLATTKGLDFIGCTNSHPNHDVLVKYDFPGIGVGRVFSQSIKVAVEDVSGNLFGNI
jgi:ribose-phosphate pyrophosphokinase